MLDSKLKKVLSVVLDCDISEINNNSSIYKIKNWDSLSHYELIEKIEKEFNVNFKKGEAETLTSYKIIYATLKSYNAK